MVRRYPLSKKDRRVLLNDLEKQYQWISFGEDSLIELYSDRDVGEVILVDGIPAFFKHGDKWYPHLKILLSRGSGFSPMVIVDQGAVKPILRGADLMAPGVRGVVGEFKPGDPVIVVEESSRKPFMVGEALVSSSDIVSGAVSRGRVVKNIHRIGDTLWRVIE